MASVPTTAVGTSISSNLSPYAQTALQVSPLYGTIISTASMNLTTFSGGIFFIPSAAAATQITLPSATNGATYTFIISGALSNAVTIAAPSAITLGNVASVDGTAVTGGAITSAKTNVIIGTTAAVGDRYDYCCDGTHYIVRGVTSVHGSVTFS